MSHTHSFCVDASCECGVTLSELVTKGDQALKALRVLAYRIEHAKQAGNSCVHISTTGLLAGWAKDALLETEGQ